MERDSRKIGSYTIQQSIYIGDKEVVFAVDQAKKIPFLVCYCSYDNPLSAAWPIDAIGTDNYLEAMQEFTDRVQAQIELTRSEQEKFKFDMAPITIEQCIPDRKNETIVGKVVVMNTDTKRHEYQHSAYQLVLADGGNGAIGGRGSAVFGTQLSDGSLGRWERYDVLGEIKSECIPEWAKDALIKLHSAQQADSAQEPDQPDLQDYTLNL